MADVASKEQTTDVRKCLIYQTCCVKLFYAMVIHSIVMNFMAH